MGNNGIRGVTGVAGATGAPGVNGIPEANITFLTGGTLGTLGAANGTDLSGFNSVVGNELIMGPGNGSDINPNTTEVPMADAGMAERLFVDVDNSPGTQANNGQPSTYFFQLCDLTTGICGPNCQIVGPETACSDPTVLDELTFAQGDLMYLVASVDYPGANHANVKWSVTYDHGTSLTP